MIRLYPANATSFVSTNGITVLDGDIIDPKVEEEINGMFKLTFRYPTRGHDVNELIHERLVVCPVPALGDQPFRIKQIVKEKNFKTFTCYHVFYDSVDNMLVGGNHIGADANNLGIWNVNISPTALLGEIKNRTAYTNPFTYVSELNSRPNAKVSVMKKMNPVQALLDGSDSNSFVSLFGGEVLRSGWLVKMQERRGTDNGVKIAYAKNLKGYEADIDYTGIITNLIPIGANNLKLYETWVINPNPNRPVYNQAKYGIIEYNDVKGYTADEIQKEKEKNEPRADVDTMLTLNQAADIMRDRAKKEFTDNKIDEPRVRYTVDFQVIGDTEEYKNAGVQILDGVDLGDTVHVEHKEEGIEITSRVTKYTWDPLRKRYLSIELGSHMTGSVGSILASVQQYEKKIAAQNERMSVTNNALEAGIAEAESYTQNEVIKIRTDLDALMNDSGMNPGYVEVTPNEIYISDKAVREDATKQWQWNSAGLQYRTRSTKHSNWSLPTTAISMDGTIVAERIAGTQITGVKIKTANTSKFVHLEQQDIYFKNVNANNAEEVKMQIGFTSPTNMNNAEPYLRMGQGDGYGRDQFKIVKARNKVDLEYIIPNTDNLASRIIMDADKDITVRGQRRVVLYGVEEGTRFAGASQLSINAGESYSYVRTQYRSATNSGGCSILHYNNTIKIADDANVVRHTFNMGSYECSGTLTATGYIQGG